VPFSLCIGPDMEGCYTIPCMLEVGPPPANTFLAQVDICVCRNKSSSLDFA
jgi:hypothetical protein